MKLTIVPGRFTGAGSLSSVRENTGSGFEGGLGGSGVFFLLIK
jgi:hypothetical protein